MKKFLIPALALFVSHAAAVAQQNLTLVIDQDAQTFDWLDGSGVTWVTGAFWDNTFGQPLTRFDAKANSPVAAYSGNGSHSGTIFQFSWDGSSIVTLGLTTSDYPGDGAVFSGTSEGAVAPTFSLGDWSRFAILDRGDYTLNPVFGSWSGGVRVVVVPEPTTWALMGLGLGAIALARTRRSKTK